MLLSSKQFPRIILTLLILLTAFIGVATYLHPMAIFPDPSWGFQVMRSMERGAGFNMLTAPDHGNLAEDYGEFLSWWSPGQYLVPYLFKSIFHTNTGQASVITTIVCEIAGLLGFYSFFRKAGFSANIAGISIAFIACQIFYVIPYVFYNGGEVLLFGFAGWFLYGCLSFNKANDWKLLLFILLSGWIGFICKSSFMWILLAGITFLWIKTSLAYKEISKWIINGIWIGVPAVIAVATIYKFYLSKGYTPTSEGKGLKLLCETFGFPVASPLLSGFSVDELTGGLLFHPDGPMFSYAVVILIIILLASLSLYLFIHILKRVPNRDYKLILSVFYVVSILFFGYSFLRQMAISFEGRHFRLIGLMFIPGTVYLISKLSPGYKIAFGVVWIGILIAALQFLFIGFKGNLQDGAHGVSGITQQFTDQQSLNEIIRLDNTEKNAVFVFISPDLGLEIAHNRFISLEPIPQNLKISLPDYQYKGHAGPLHIFVPKNYKGVKATMLMKCFPDYKGFKLMELSDDYVMYTAN